MSHIRQIAPSNFERDQDADEFTLFANALKSLRVDEIEPLDPEHGPAAVWKRVCESKLDDRNSPLTPEQKDYWNLERNTWQLVHMLYTERTSPSQSTSSKAALNPYLPPLNVVNYHLSKTKDLLELSIFRDWLHTCPSNAHPSEIRRGYWPYTKASIKHALQKYPQSDSRGPSGKPRPFHSMDPDAPLRSMSQPSTRSQAIPVDESINIPQEANMIQEKGELEHLDQEYERAIVKTLYEYIRAGEIGLALDFCRQCDHHWRAASIAGGRLFHDAALGNPENETTPFPQEEMLNDSESIDTVMNESRNLPPYSQVNRSGCLNRKLWKAMCLHMSSNKSLPTYEQALYGALAGEISSVLPVCYTWEDHIWCYINSIFENEVDRILESNQLGYYWSHGTLPKAEDRDIATLTHNLSSSSIQHSQIPHQDKQEHHDDESQPDIKTAMDKAFDKILRSQQRHLAESARNPFHVAQMWLAIDRINDLFTSFSENLKSSSVDFTKENLSQILRFFSHLILFLRSINEKVDAEASTAILRSYVHVLEKENKHDLIAFYVAELQPESGVETYAKYLISLGTSSDFSTRRVALLRALEHGLDLPRVACTAVKFTLQEIKYASLESNREHGLNRFSHRLTNKQNELIRSLEWLIIDPVTYLDALIQANSLMRYFLTTGHPNAARKVVRSMPADVLSVIAQGKDPLEKPQAEDILGNTHNEILEFTQYRDFFNCLELHVQVDEIFSQRPIVGAPKSELQAFTQVLEEMCDELYAAVVGLLSSEWLQDVRFHPAGKILQEMNPKSCRRIEELKVIRKIYIPELVFRLHGALVDSGSYLPTNLRRALELATVVSNESFQNYAEFLPSTKIDPGENQSSNKQQHKMKDYLRELRLVHLLILKSSGIHPLRPTLK